MSTYANPVLGGRWLYLVQKDPGEEVSISVKSKDQITDLKDLILTKCWIATGSHQINSKMDLMMSVVADVHQGNTTVVGAIVECPSDDEGNPYLKWK